MDLKELYLWKRVLRIGMVFGCFVGLFCACKPNPSEQKEKPRPPFPELCEGDIVFRRGVGAVSRMVLATGGRGAYSHLGIVVRQGEKWKVVHAVPGEPDFKGDPDRVKMDDLAVFFSRERAESGALMQLLAFQAQARHAARKAVELYQRGILFDHSYDSGDSTKMYCTELVEWVYRDAGVDLTEGRCRSVPFLSKNGTAVFPSDIQVCSKLGILYQF